MGVDLFSAVFSGIHFAALGALYSIVITIFWSPFLLAKRVRRLFERLPPADWRVSYVLWMALPSMVWAFIFGCVIVVSSDVRPPTVASEVLVVGFDGLVAATVISILLWPIMLLYVLPSRGFDWDTDESTPRTVVLVVGATIWYLSWLVVPMALFVYFAAWGDVVAGP